MVQLQICKIRIMEEAGLSNSVLRETKRQFCHSRIDTTARYTAVSPATIGKTASPLDLLLKPGGTKPTKRKPAKP